LVVVLSTAALQGCATESGRGGVRLPQGDAAKGREAFVELRCTACHKIEGFDPPTPIVAATRVTLGGQTARVRTYEDIVTSIANPSHRVADGYPPEAVTVNGVPLMSLIRLNEVMTVQQLIDLAAFLQTKYDVVPPPVQLDDVYESDDPGAISQPPPL
jgi:hypothetical protein